MSADPQVLGGLRFVAISDQADRVKIYARDVQTWVEPDRKTAREIARFILRELGEGTFW